MKHIHILGICGTFMGSLAVIARELGIKVTGSDQNVYPPMSTYLESEGIEIMQGYGLEQLELKPDVFVIGNTIKRGEPIVEALLNQKLPLMSGPQFLEEAVLKNKWVLAVTGTHGKTTTSSMLAWVLEYAGYEPGFLIGGIPQNFGVSARLGKSDFFVIEGDEYDTAFFDKRSKFVHYWPRTVILNNLELDHVDIFENLAAIQKQFHHLIRMLPSEGLVITHEGDQNLEEVLAKGLWTPKVSFGQSGDYAYQLLAADASAFKVFYQQQAVGEVHWQIMGEFNIENALAVIAAAKHVGIPESVACEALGQFISPKRRLEVRGEVGGVTVYDDFAHHPTAIAKTIEALRNKVGQARILAVFEPRSNSMKLGQFQQNLAEAMQGADQIFLYEPPQLSWSVAAAFKTSQVPTHIVQDIDVLVQAIAAEMRPGDHVLIMSNGGFGGLHHKLLVYSFASSV
jgi:UDP-N-acetylmuramate: L-alanyl-gamma-D-glutamyl-meso-diaminopimelate ligase